MLKRNLLFLISFCFLFSCGKENKILSKEKEGVNNPESVKDIFAHKAVPQFAKHYSVSYHGNYKVVHTHATFSTDGESSKGNQQKDIAVLVQKGTAAPPLTGALEDAVVLYIPVETVALNEHHAECFLRELGLEDRINAIGGPYSYDSLIRKRAFSGELGQIGYSWYGPPNIEVLLEREPEVFINTIGSLDHTSSLEKCRQLGIPTATAFDWAEENYLARAEWIKFYSLFFNAEEQANLIFQAIVDRVNDLKAKVAKIKEKPSAMWGFYIGKQRWHMQLSSYSGQYMRDAGLENVLRSNTQADANGAQTLSTEELMLKGREAEHWIIGDIHAGPLPKESIMSSFKAWRSGQLYHNMQRANLKANTSDWDAQAIVRPDSVLADLIKLVHPALLPEYTPVFLGPYSKT